MKIYEVKFRRVLGGETTYSKYFKSLATALDYVGDNFRFGVHSKMKFMDEVDSNCSSITFFPYFLGEAKAAGRSAYPYFLRVLDVI